MVKDEDGVRNFLQRTVSAFQSLAHHGHIRRSPAILTGADSAWYDVVVEEFGKARIAGAIDIVL